VVTCEEAVELANPALLRVSSRSHPTLVKATALAACSV